jgi:hypothetical protein
VDRRKSAARDGTFPADGGEIPGHLPRGREHDEQLARLYATGQSDPGNSDVFERIKQALGDKRYEEYRATWWK